MVNWLQFNNNSLEGRKNHSLLTITDIKFLLINIQYLCYHTLIHL